MNWSYCIKLYFFMLNENLSKMFLLDLLLNVAFSFKLNSERSHLLRYYSSHIKMTSETSMTKWSYFYSLVPRVKMGENEKYFRDIMLYFKNGQMWSKCKKKPKKKQEKHVQFMDKVPWVIKRVNFHSTPRSGRPVEVDSD